MGPTVTFLISTGLCLGWAVRAQMDPLPRPTLWAVPSPVVPGGADVTLRCQGHLGSNRVQLWSDGEIREDRNAFWQQAEFVLRAVDPSRDGRSYSCRSGQGPLWSELSEPLDLVVTGAFPKPSISATRRSPIIPSGTTVAIWCDISPQTPPQEYSFALLEEKSLEPLQTQSPTGSRAVFLLSSVRPEDTGSYSCIYYRKTAPHRGSHPSQTLELTVSGHLSRPTLWAQPGLLVFPGTNITLWCSSSKSSLEEVTFTLWKAGTQEPLQQQTSADFWTSFLLPSVRPEDTGSYSCAYREKKDYARESKPSEALELVVPGSLPKPSLSAFPGLVVEPGMHVTLQCWQPPQTSSQRVTFTLLKVGTPQALQSQSPAGTSAAFPLLSVRAQDAGNYSCVYYERMSPYQVSEPSEVLELWVTDALPKPSLSVWPGPEVTSGADVTLLCQGPSWNTGFILYKEGHMNRTQDEAQFLLRHMTPEASGNYSCSYQLSINGSHWTQHSDPLEIIVRAPSNTLLITLSCVSFLLICLLLLLLAIFCHRSSPIAGALHRDCLRRFFCCPRLPQGVCLPRHPEAPRDETLYTEVANERPREPSIAMATNPEGVTYAHLKIRTLNKSQTDPKEKPIESTVYATVCLD